MCNEASIRDANHMRTIGGYHRLARRARSLLRAAVAFALLPRRPCELATVEDATTIGQAKCTVIAQRGECGMPTQFRSFLAGLAPRAHCIKCLSRFYEVDTSAIAGYLAALETDATREYGECRNCGTKTDTFVLTR